MSLQRNRRNLRGYGLAQNPKFKPNTSGLADDQLRRQAQDKSLENAAANRAQRDAQYKAGLVSKIPSLKNNWSASVGNKIKKQQEEVIANAANMSAMELAASLSGLNNNINTYNQIGEQIQDRAKKVVTGEVYSGVYGDKLLQGDDEELESMFEKGDLESNFSLATGTLGGEFAAVPKDSELIKGSEQIINIAKQGNPEIVETGRSPLGKRLFSEFFNIDPAAREALAENIMSNHADYYRLRGNKENLDLQEGEEPIDYKSQILSRIPQTAKGGNFTDKLSTNTRDTKEPEYGDPEVVDIEISSGDPYTKITSTSVPVPKALSPSVLVDADGGKTPAKAEKIFLDKDGIPKVQLTYKVKNKDTGDDAAAYISSTTDIGLDDYMKTVKKDLSSDEFKDLQRFADELKSKDQEKTFDFDAAMKDSTKWNIIGKNEGEAVSEKITNELSNSGVALSDINNDPDGELDLSFKVGDNTFEYNFNEESDRKKFLEDKKNNFIKEGKSTSNKSDNPAGLDL